MLNIHDLKAAYEKAIGHETSKSTIYNLMARHGWRKLMPRPFHPRRDIADARERIDHEADEGADADDGRDIDRVDELARLRRVEHRRLAAPDDMARPAHGAGGIGRHDLPEVAAHNGFGLRADLAAGGAKGST